MAIPAAPSRAKSVASCRPNPCEAPVIRMYFPFNLFISQPPYLIVYRSLPTVRVIAFACAWLGPFHFTGLVLLASIRACAAPATSVAGPFVPYILADTQAPSINNSSCCPSLDDQGRLVEEWVRTDYKSYFRSLAHKESSWPEMIVAILSIVSLSSLGSLGQSTFPHSRNPFAYVGRTVSKFDSVGFRNGERPDHFKTHHRDLREI